MHTACNWPFWNICVIILWFGTFLFFSPPLLRQPVIGHNTDRSTADKAVIIILSPLTDKQACFSGGTEEKPLTLGNGGKKKDTFFFYSKTATVFFVVFLPWELLTSAFVHLFSPREQLKLSSPKTDCSIDLFTHKAEPTQYVCASCCVQNLILI